ncbi:hypothetical protein [Luteibacter sp.]|uniref:hypothetical protein n=1 Tax=Luteibacter sp. TaxID=1886636 RepID=UPI003F7D1652
MGNENTAINSAELFSFNAKYSINDDNSARDLLGDASIFLSSGIEIFIQEIEAIDGSNWESKKAVCECLWGAYHLFKMAKGTVDAANTRLHARRED